MCAKTMILHLSFSHLWIAVVLMLPALATGRTVRIVPAGSSPVSQGILEVNRTGSWQILCVWGFGDVEAHVACRELGFAGGTALPIAAYGPHSGVYTTPFRGCKGDETSLLDCSFDGQGHVDICRGQDTYYATVHCYNDIKTLQGASVNLTNGYHGKVAYFQSGVWGQVCLTYWRDNEASVACRELGYKGGVVTRAESAQDQPFTLTGIQCHGNESRLSDCKHTLDICYDTANRASVVCYNSGLSMHLADDDGRSGQVEINYDGVDGFLALCGLDQTDTRYSKTPSFICRQLGFATGSFIRNAPVTQGDVYWTIEECDGTENSIFMCRNQGWLPDRTSNCSTDDNIVAVSCNIGVNLLGGITTENATMGMVEMFTTGKWATVCAHDFGEDEAVVVCRQLGFTDAQLLLPDMFGHFRFLTFATDLACIGNETSLNDCAHTTDICQYSSHASVLCTNGRVSTDFKAYLSHGSYGTVVIEKYDMMGTVCRHGWDDQDSRVLCSQLGHQGGVTLGTRTLSTRYNPIWLSDVNCTGQENRIQECKSELSVYSSCGTDLAAAGALCYNDTKPSVNIVKGSKPSEGRAEVTYFGVSGTICDYGWSGHDANVLCRQLGYPTGKPKKNSFHGPGVGPVYLDQVQCDGTESSILSCPNMGWNLSSQGCAAHNDDAGVTCLPWARLLTSRYYGAVMFWNEELSNYGLVCDDGHFGNKAAEIFCKEQGNQNGIAVRCSTFGDMVYPYTISSVDCDGSETKLTDCKYNRTSYCPSNEYISVVCAFVWTPSSATKITLQNADHGYVKVYHFHQYGYICSEGFDDMDATVICKMKGYVYGTAYRHHTQTEKLDAIHKSTIRWLSNLNCNSTANTLDDCDLRWGETCPCDQRTVAGVFCLSQPASTMIELENGTAMEGRVLTKVNADTTGLVCGDYFSHTEADVICRQLGYRSGISLDAGSHGNAVGAYFLDSMTCNGNETSFLECALEPHYHFVDCRSGAAAVKCYHNVRLTGGLMKPYFGRVELHNGQRWEAVCDENFDETDARVVCESLGYVTGRSQCCSSFGPQPTDLKIQVTNMTCDGTEDRPQDCSYDTKGACPSNRYASVLCSTMATMEDIAVRLPGNSYYGPVEVRRYGIWGYVCAAGWDDKDAEVTCRTLGYRTGRAVRNLVKGRDVIILGNVRCRGVEQHFGDCILDQFGEDTGCFDRGAIAGVICLNTSDALSFHIRGTGKSSALYIHADSHDMYIDKSEFDDVAASLVCKEIDLTYVDGSAFGFTSLIPGVVKFHCSGNEQSVFDCIGDWNPTNEAVTIASVSCHRGVKLVGGGTHYGVVEVYNSGTWGTICAATFSDSDAGVVCRNLGFADGISLCCSPFGKADSHVLVSFLQCSGMESDLRECHATFVHPNNAHSDKDPCTSTDAYAAVVCYNGARPEGYTLSLPKPSFGHASELVVTYLGVSGRICADGWSDNDAKVACKEQGFKYGIAYTHYVENGTQSNGPYWTSNFTCSGLESDLQDCGHVGLGRVLKCDKIHFAGVICFDAEGPTYRISGGDRNSTWGRVEIRLPGEGWGAICNTYWGQNEALALCRQFGYDIGKPYHGEYSMPPPHLVYDVKYMCTGNEDRLKDCPHGGWLQSYISTCSSHHSDAGVICDMIDVPVTGTKGLEPGPEPKGNIGLVVGVILGCVLIIVLVVIVILVLKWRQSQKGFPGHEQFHNDILHQGHDGSFQLHNPLHGDNNIDSGPISIDTSGAVSYRSGNTDPNTSRPHYVNPTYDTTHNTTTDKRYDEENISRDNDSNIHNVVPSDTNNEHDVSESSYAKLDLPADSHIYEGCDQASVKDIQ